MGVPGVPGQKGLMGAPGMDLGTAMGETVSSTIYKFTNCPIRKCSISSIDDSTKILNTQKQLKPSAPYIQEKMAIGKYAVSVLLIIIRFYFQKTFWRSLRHKKGLTSLIREIAVAQNF